VARIFTAPAGTRRPDHVDEILDPVTLDPIGPWKETRVNGLPPGDPEAKVDSEYKRLMDRGMNHNEALVHLRAKRITEEPEASAPRVTVRDA
jgi:hypothetical protein